MNTNLYGVCERLSAAFLAEPMNLLSSVLFVVVAVALGKQYKLQSGNQGISMQNLDIHLLIVFAAMIGINSSLLHTIPNGLTALLDSSSIALFIVIFFFSALIRVIGCNLIQTLVAFAGFLFLTHVTDSLLFSVLDGASSYFSTMAVLSMMAFFLYGKGSSSAKHFLAAALLGVISLFFRSLDSQLCNSLPMGTHWLWHALNAALIYIVVREIIKVTYASRTAVQPLSSFNGPLYGAGQYAYVPSRVKK